jgi:hypothetical protein
MSRTQVATRLLVTPFSAGVLPAASIIQSVHNNAYSVVSGAATIPFDGTIPQNTEGFEAMTLSITPTSVTNIIRIEACAICWTAGTNVQGAYALFRDSFGADALAVVPSGPQVTGNGGSFGPPFRFQEVVGSLATQTYRVRVGGNDGSTMYFNDQAGLGKYSGRIRSYMTLTEIAV